MPELAYVNGEFGPVTEASVSIEDRGFQFGDGVYEVIVAYGGRLFLLEPHMRRLRRSAAAIRLDYNFDASPLEPVITEGLRRSGFSDAMIYVQLTRGVAPRSHVPPERMPCFRSTWTAPSAAQRQSVQWTSAGGPSSTSSVIQSMSLTPSTSTSYSRSRQRSVCSSPGAV